MSEARTSSCPHCCQPMKLVHTIPPLSPTWPAILSFYCEPWRHAETKRGVLRHRPNLNPPHRPSTAAFLAGSKGQWLLSSLLSLFLLEFSERIFSRPCSNFTGFGPLCCYFGRRRRGAPVTPHSEFEV